MNKKASSKPAEDKNQSSAGGDAGTSGIDNASLTESTEMVMGTTSSLSVAGDDHNGDNLPKDNSLVNFKVSDDYKGGHLMPGKVYPMSPESADQLAEKGHGTVVDDGE